MSILDKPQEIINTSGHSERFNQFLSHLEGVPEKPSARVLWLASLFDTHRNTPRGWIYENKVPHKLDEIIGLLVSKYADSKMDTESWVAWIKWGGKEPQPVLAKTPSFTKSIDHDFRRDMYLVVDRLSAEKGLHIEDLPKIKRNQLYDLIIMHSNAEGSREINKAFVEALLDLLI